MKYIGERKIKFLDLTFLPNFQQLNLDQSTTLKKKFKILFSSSIRNYYDKKKKVKNNTQLLKKNPENPLKLDDLLIFC